MMMMIIIIMCISVNLQCIDQCMIQWGNMPQGWRLAPPISAASTFWQEDTLVFFFFVCLFVLPPHHSLFFCIAAFSSSCYSDVGPVCVRVPCLRAWRGLFGLLWSGCCGRGLWIGPIDLSPCCMLVHSWASLEFVFRFKELFKFWMFDCFYSWLIYF